MQQMTPDERRAFLLAGTRTGKLATVREDGRPHVVPIWFTLDGDEVIFTTWHTTMKARNLQHDPHVAICVDDDRPPFAFVQIEGTARWDARVGDLLEWATRIAARYMDPEQAERFGKRNAVEGELLVRVSPTKFIARKGISD